MYLSPRALCDNLVSGEKVPYRVQRLHLLLENSLGVFPEQGMIVGETDSARRCAPDRGVTAPNIATQLDDHIDQFDKVSQYFLATIFLGHRYEST
jgi:hypothetical protein